MPPATPYPDDARAAPWLAALLRALLILGCLGAVFFAAAAAQPSAHLVADVELARLLRGMALIKGMLCLTALAVLLWRLGRPVSLGLTVSYLAGAWLVSGASMAIWQLASVPLAAVLFHAGELTLLVAAWLDRRDPVRRAARVRAPQSAAPAAPAAPVAASPGESSGLAAGRA